MRFVRPELNDPMSHPKAVRRAVAQRQEAVAQAFRDHNARIRPLLPPSLQWLQEAYIHDAQIQSLQIDTVQQTVQLVLTCFDSPVGYFNLDLKYKDIQLTAQEISLFCLIAHREDAEVYWGEVDIVDIAGGAGSTDAARLFVHRILWNTNVVTGRDAAQGVTYRSTLTPEIELRFGDFEMEVTPNAVGGFSRADDFITVVRDPNKIEGMDDFVERAI